MKKIKKGFICYEKVVAGRIYGKWIFYDKKTKKKYGYLNKKELDKLFLT